MDTSNGVVENNKLYFNNLMLKHSSKEKLDYFIKQTLQSVEGKIEDGSLEVKYATDKDKNQHSISSLLKRKQINPFESHYRGFFLNTDREKSQQRYEIFKKIKEQYSKEKTAIVVKDVEKRIKEWTEKKLTIDKMKRKSIEQKSKIQMQLIGQLKKAEVERQQEDNKRRKQELSNRLKILEEKKERRENLMKESSVRSMEIRQPKYKQIEERFKQIQEKIQEEQERILQRKRQTMRVKKQQIQEHERKYQQLRKQKEQQRKQKMKYQKMDQIEQKREDFTLFTNEDKEKKDQSSKKRKKMKQFEKKVKSLIVLAKPNQVDNDQQSKSIKNGKHDVDQKINQQGKKIRRRNRKIDQSANGRQLGNNYLRELKEKDKDILNNSSKLKLHQSVSLPSIKPIYKNYLTEVKIKRRPVGDQIEQLKRSCQSRSEVYQILNRKSNLYEQSMLKKINDLKKINKYDESVLKQSQIDDIYSRYIKMRLACIEV